MLKKALAIVALFAFAAGAQAQMKPEDQIKFRQSGYSFMGWNMGKIKAQVIDAPANYNKEQVLAAARVIAAIANSGMGALYGPGTDKGKGWHETHLKPEFFQQQDEVRNVAMTFIKESNELAKVAESGDVNSIKAQFGKVADSCGACHKKFRRED